ncbi:HNH endonuclease family protein, partial [Bacillus sp. JJ1566]|uniref:HNH endonuclease family protein n=1 Tax=Bacillus sp. JJ1566 TaxID=3122961 RepID=UPI002FFDE0E0
MEKIDNSMGTGETKPSNNDLVHVEHILPKKPNSDWIVYLDQFEEEYEDFINRIGNLTLLSGTFNREASNKMFDIKKNNYK